MARSIAMLREWSLECDGNCVSLGMIAGSRSRSHYVTGEPDLMVEPGGRVAGWLYRLGFLVALPSWALLLFALPSSSLCAADGADKTTLKKAVASDSLSAQAARDEEFFRKELKPFLQEFCLDCHSGEAAEAGIDFEQYTSAKQLTEQRPRWNQVRGLIEIGAMPPADYGLAPEVERRERIADWIDRKVNTVNCNLVNDPGRVTMRRLNNYEYDATLRDLLGIDYSPSQQIGFPSDGVGNGFDNQGDVLTLSPLQLEKYMQAAQLIVERGIALDMQALREQRREGEALFVKEASRHTFVFAEGEYIVRIRMKYGNQDEESVPVGLFIDGQEVKRWEVGRKRETYELGHQFQAGRHEIAVVFDRDPNSEERGDYGRRVDIDYVSIEGPDDGSPAPPIPHQRLITSLPSAEKSVEQAAEEIFGPFLLKAFRRPPTPADVQRLVNLVSMAVDAGESFEQGVSFGLQSVLVSPNFLFRIEEASGGEAVIDSAAEALDDFALASRLSYFLWSSMPDEELLQLASEERLHEPDVLRQQAKRMLSDPRSRALVSRFFGQLLGLGGLRDVDPDLSQFPLWNDRLREAMRKEVELFCGEIVERDLPVSTLLQGDFTYINPRLAELYGLQFEGQDPEELYKNGPGFPARRRGNQRQGLYEQEDHWVRIELPEKRRGVLTQGAILTLTSNPTSTSPVKRGKWILENILGDPPPPAPPNVPSFEETQQENEGLSLREQLEIHRANPSCASCHDVMDPLGLGFENFDAIGRWRDKDGEHLIDASGKLADGSRFDGATQLVGLLRNRKAEVARHFAEKLLTYALGRGLEPFDNCAVDEIMAYADQQEYRFSAFVEAIVVSQPFSQRKSIQEQ